MECILDQGASFSFLPLLNTVFFKKKNHLQKITITFKQYFVRIRWLLKISIARKMWFWEILKYNFVSDTSHQGKENITRGLKLDWNIGAQRPRTTMKTSATTTIPQRKLCKMISCYVCLWPTHQWPRLANPKVTHNGNYQVPLLKTLMARQHSIEYW